MKMKLSTITISFLLMMSGFFVVVSGEDTVVSVEEDVSEPIEIYDWHDLDEVREDLDGDYILMNELDEDTDGYDELVGTENGQDPIGDFGDRFTGTFDGNEHEISDIYIDRLETRYVGLFGRVDRIDKGGEVLNVGVVDADVSGDRFVGGLVGRNTGTVSNSYASGTVIGEEKVGGLVGYNWGTVENSFWNIETSGQNESDGGEGKTTEEMINKETFTDEGWDLEDTWDIIEKETYPFLQWQDEDSYPYAPELDEDDDDGIPGFTMPLLALAVVVALVVYYKKRW